MKRLQTTAERKEVVLSYIKALDHEDYDSATYYLRDSVMVSGPSGESFAKPKDFIEMLRRCQGKYAVRKIIADKEDVCVLYDLKTQKATVLMSSWYHVKDGKIDSIQSVFDPRPFATN